MTSPDLSRTTEGLLFGARVRPRLRAALSSHLMVARGDGGRWTSCGERRPPWRVNQRCFELSRTAEGLLVGAHVRPRLRAASSSRLMVAHGGEGSDFARGMKTTTTGESAVLAGANPVS